MKKRILCMGAINIDLTMYMHRLPLAGETIVTDNFQTFPGGKGGNQAAAAATLELWCGILPSSGTMHSARS